MHKTRKEEYEIWGYFGKIIKTQKTTYNISLIALTLLEEGLES